MKKLLAIAAFAAMTAAACATTPGGGGGGLTVGCYDSDDSADSLIYNGPIGTYKNAQFAINNTGCGSDPVNDYVTVVLASDEASALAACQTGPDPAADAAANLAALGFDTMPSNAWYCGNPLSGALLQPDQCLTIGTASVKYLGPRNSQNNVVLFSDTLCTAATPNIFTYVQHSTQAAAIAMCASIDPAFDTASALSALPFNPAIPNDTYLCSNAP
jgi:hypothetical protein